MPGRLEQGQPDKSSRQSGAIPKSKMLAKIVASPKSDWTILDLETACEQLGMICSAPTRGSHYKISSPYVGGILIVPYNKPIKRPYIKSFLGLTEAHIAALRAMEDTNE